MINKAIIVGRIGKDPEVRYSSSGTAVCNVSVATSRKYKDKSGEKVEETEWHRVVVYDKLAEIVGQWVKKGALVYFEGRLKTRKWADKDGTEKYTTEIVADQMQMMGGDKEKEEKPSHSEMKRGSSAPPRKSNDFDDDVPF